MGRCRQEDHYGLLAADLAPGSVRNYISRKKAESDRNRTPVQTHANTSHTRVHMREHTHTDSIHNHTTKTLI